MAVLVWIGSSLISSVDLIRLYYYQSRPIYASICFTHYSGYTCRHAIHAYARRESPRYNVTTGIFLQKKNPLSDPVPAKSPQATHQKIKKNRSEHHFPRSKTVLRLNSHPFRLWLTVIRDSIAISVLKRPFTAALAFSSFLFDSAISTVTIAVC